MRRFGSRDDHESRGAFVEAVHDPRAVAPGFIVVIIERATSEEGIDQCAGTVSCCRMDDHPCRLVNDQQVIVFVHDIESDSFSLWRRLLRR